MDSYQESVRRLILHSTEVYYHPSLYLFYVSLFNVSKTKKKKKNYTAAIAPLISSQHFIYSIYPTICLVLLGRKLLAYNYHLYNNRLHPHLLLQHFSSNLF